MWPLSWQKTSRNTKGMCEGYILTQVPTVYLGRDPISASSQIKPENKELCAELQSQGYTQKPNEKEGDQRCAGWYLGFPGWELKRLVRKQRLMRMWRQTPEWNGLKTKRGEDLEALNIGCCCKSRQWNCGDCKSRWGRGLCKMYSGIWSERFIPQAGSLLLDYLYVRFMNYFSGLLIPTDSIFIVTSEWSCLRPIMQRLIEEDTQCPTLASANTLRGVPIYTCTSINHTPQYTHTNKAFSLHIYPEARCSLLLLLRWEPPCSFDGLTQQLSGQSLHFRPKLYSMPSAYHLESSYSQLCHVCQHFKTCSALEIPKYQLSCCSTS